MAYNVLFYDFNINYFFISLQTQQQKIMSNYAKWYGKESDFQETVARFLDSLEVAWNHCPNGGNRNSREGASLKRQGVKAGFPDISIFEPRGSFHGLFIELKRDGEKPRANQLIWLNDLYSKGYQTAVTDSMEELIEIVNTYLKQ
jgi:hypothetical protein